MANRKIKETLKAVDTHDGEGVNIRRSLGMRPLSWHDPFLLLDEFYSEGPEAGGGFPDHPHRGFSTLTYMLKGHMNHKDNQGNAGRVGPGGFQWMTAGKGIIHSEKPEPEEEGMRGLQLWVNLPSKLKMRDPFYINGEAEEIPEITKNWGRVRVIAGNFEDNKSPLVDEVTGLSYLDITFEKETEQIFPIPQSHQAFLYCLEGEIKIGKDSLPAHTLAILGNGESVKIRSLSPKSRLVLVSGKPSGERIARYGPFVMNNREEIEQAVSDFQSGKF